MFFKRLWDNRLAGLAMLLTALIFGYFGYLLVTETLTFEAAKDGAFFVWACVMLLMLVLAEKGGGKLNSRRLGAAVRSVLSKWSYANRLYRNMMDDEHGWVPPAEGRSSTKSKRTFGSTIGGHVAHLTVSLKQLVSQGIIGQSSLRMARATA